MKRGEGGEKETVLLLSSPSSIATGRGVVYPSFEGKLMILVTPVEESHDWGQEKQTQ